ncbi:MAG: TatD family deoxyribonuclease [Actinobacteria bacterium]|jgi:TatD DNase family protein|nr:TatD family deoxyribonuclease [Actinomycetota bacterium]NCU89397.1 TatD family deoxyribonuclease [Actinomycetota bacterium]NDE53427.1 TatD family deoxyribonuclease [Actinomycetota bacterium]
MADRHNRDLDRQPAPLPEALPVPCVDSHAHLEIVTNTDPDHPEIKRVLDEAASVGINRIVQVGYSAEQSEWSVRCAEKWNSQVLAAVALHPNEAPVVDDLEKDLAVIDRLASHPRVRAIGETGLDFFRTEPVLQDRQIYSFKRHIEIAKLHRKALVIHDRDAHRAVLDVLESEGAPDNTVFHCYSGDAEMARECVEKGYVLSFAGTVTFKNAPQLREAVKLVPSAQLLVETDSPFLAPMPHRGSLNTPAQIPHIVRFIAQERGDDLVELTTSLSNNAERIFGSFQP